MTTHACAYAIGDQDVLLSNLSLIMKKKENIFNSVIYKQIIYFEKLLSIPFSNPHDNNPSDIPDNVEFNVTVTGIQTKLCPNSMLLKDDSNGFAINFVRGK